MDKPTTMLELPIFPLNVVLFPGMPLPLHIFEERYKQMIERCLELVRRHDLQGDAAEGQGCQHHRNHGQREPSPQGKSFPHWDDSNPSGHHCPSKFVLTPYVRNLRGKPCTIRRNRQPGY